MRPHYGYLNETRSEVALAFYDHVCWTSTVSPSLGKSAVVVIGMQS